MRHRAATPHETTARAVVSAREGERQWAESSTRSKGRLKEAAGVLTDDDRLRREGQLDQVVGKVKGTAERAVDTVKDALTGNRPRRPAK